MYVNHLDAWGFTKNYTEARVSNILHQKSQRGADNKVSKFGGEGTRPDIKKIEKFLARKKTSLKTFISAEEEKDMSMHDEHQPPQPTISNNEKSFTYTSANSDRANQALYEDYEDNCPYRQRTQKFRLIEKFTEYYALC